MVPVPRRFPADERSCTNACTLNNPCTLDSIKTLLKT